MEGRLMEMGVSKVVKLGKYVFLPERMTLMCGDCSVRLTRKECGLLSLFCDFANKLLPRSHALTNVWTQNNRFNARSMDVYVTKLRKYLKCDPEITITNIRGKGYIMHTPFIE